MLCLFSHSPQHHFSSYDQFDDDMALAIALSLGNQQSSTVEGTQQIQQPQQQSTALVAPQIAALSEDEILEQVLKLSLTEK